MTPSKIATEPKVSISAEALYGEMNDIAERRWALEPGQAKSAIGGALKERQTRIAALVQMIPGRSHSVLLEQIAGLRDHMVDPVANMHLTVALQTLENIMDDVAMRTADNPIDAD